MGSFKSFIESKGITAAQVATTSRRIEAYDEAARGLLVKRAAKRRVKETSDKKYADLGLAKPGTSGRGISQQQVELAMADMKGLFEGAMARVGKKPQAASDKKA